jgi:hypothetical protein
MPAKHWLYFLFRTKQLTVFFISDETTCCVLVLCFKSRIFDVYAPKPGFYLKKAKPNPKLR